MRLATRLAAAALLVSLASPARAQFTQYSRPGGGDFAVAGSSISDQVEEAMEGARWNWGKAAVEPWIAIRELTYDDNVGRLPDDEGEKISDISMTIGAGLRAYLPGGAGLVWSAHALPQYVWWQDLENRRHFGGRYGLGLFGNVGRTALELSVSLDDGTRFFSREFEDQVEIESTLGRGAIDFALGGGFSLFGEGSVQQLRYGEGEEDLPPLRTVDRDETVGRTMLRHRPRDGFLLGLGAEYSQAEFDPEGEARDNSGTGAAFEVRYLGRNLSILGDVVDRSLSFDDGRSGLDYDGLTGHVAFRLVTSPRWQPRVYWVRNLVYSFSETWPYFLDELVGAGFDGDLTSAITLRLWAESGDNEYVPLEETGPARVDDLVVTGGELVFRLGPGQLILGGYRTDYESNLPEFDRTVTVYRFGFVVGERTISPWG